MSTSTMEHVLKLVPVDADLREIRQAFAKNRIDHREPLTDGIPNGYSISKDGVFFVAEEQDNADSKPVFVCTELRVIALIRDHASSNWGRVVRFTDADGVRHEDVIPMELLAGDGSDLRKKLGRQGVIIATTSRGRSHLLRYISEARPTARARCVQQIGWSNGCFVFPDLVVGKKDEVILYQSPAEVAPIYRRAGTVEQWRQNVGERCRGNSRLILAVSAAFAGMLLHLAEHESGGIHLVGGSSTGKSTAQSVAASVYGGASFKQSWRATGNALEATCALHNDTALILDEMAEVDAKEIGNIVYMIGNGIGKGRAGRSGEIKQRKTWRVMLLSSGEIGLGHHIADGGGVARAGQEVRMIDLTADAGLGLGVFEELHGFAAGSQFSEALNAAARTYYGTPAIAFLEKLTQEEPESFRGELREATQRFVAEFLPEGAGGQAARVCKRFALIAVAGEYATDAGITGWLERDAYIMAGKCFLEWLEYRGGTENLESANILAKVKSYFEANGESRFTEIRGGTDRVTLNRAGFRETTDGETRYFVLPEAYKRDICNGYAPATVTKTLLAAGWIEPDKSGKTALQNKRIRGMGTTRCYVFTSKMWK